MSHDYLLLVDSTVPAQSVRDHLVDALGLQRGEGDEVTDPAVLVSVREADARTAHLAEPGIARPTLRIRFMPKARSAGHDAADTRTHQLAAAIMRFCPGDAAFTFEEASTSILRLGDTVYVDPAQVAARLLPEAAFAPARVVAGLPTEAVANPAGR